MDERRVVLEKLRNGLRIVLYPMPEMESVSVGIWVKMGGRFESARYKGISHFLEHMVFKGSRRYSCRRIKEELEGVGGSLNAFTSEENTCYLVKIPARHLRRAIKVLSDMVLFPLLPEDELERERLVIFEEIRMYMDLPQAYVVELAQELLWEGHPLGQPLAGTITTVGRITREVMAKFQARYYRPNNIVVALAGKIEGPVMDWIREEFESVPKGARVVDNPFRGTQRRPKLKLLSKPTEQSHLCLCMPAYSYSDDRRYAQEVLNIILGGNMSSRLFNEVREKRGLAYHISSSLSKMKETGGLFIKAGTEHKRLPDTLKVILRELEKMASGRISAGEFKRGKEYLLGQVVLHLEDTMENMLLLGGKLLNQGIAEDPREVMKRISEVSLEDVRAVARDLFDPKRYNLAIIGPAEEYESKIRKMYVG